MRKARPWATTRRYLEQLKGLLRGEVVEVDGERCQMIHHPDWAAARPLDVPLLLSAFGPKGKDVLAARNRFQAAAPSHVGGTVSLVDEPGNDSGTVRPA